MTAKRLKRNPDTVMVKLGENKTEGRKVTWSYIIKAGQYFEEWTEEFQNKSLAAQWFKKWGGYWKERGYDLHLMRKETNYRYNKTVFS